MKKTAFKIGSGALAFASLSLLIMAWRLEPNLAGVGTHTQLGLPRCSWMVWFGRPCMTCGMTTAFANVADLKLIAAFKAQPLGALLALCTPVIAIGAAHQAVTGARIDRMVLPMIKPRALWVMGGLLVGAWMYKLAVTPVP